MLIDSFHVSKELRILPAFILGITQSFTAVAGFVVNSQDHSPLPRIFHYTFGHHSHLAAGKTWGKSIAGRHQPLWLNPCSGISVLLHPAKPERSWGVSLGRWTPKGDCSSTSCSLLEHCSALLLPQIISKHIIPSSTRCLRYIPTEFHVLFEKITPNQCGRWARKTSVAK